MTKAEKVLRVMELYDNELQVKSEELEEIENRHVVRMQELIADVRDLMVSGPDFSRDTVALLPVTGRTGVLCEMSDRSRKNAKKKLADISKLKEDLLQGKVLWPCLPFQQQEKMKRVGELRRKVHGEAEEDLALWPLLVEAFQRIAGLHQDVKKSLTQNGDEGSVLSLKDHAEDEEVKQATKIVSCGEDSIDEGDAQLDQ